MLRGIGRSLKSSFKMTFIAKVTVISLSGGSLQDYGVVPHWDFAF